MSLPMNSGIPEQLKQALDHVLSNENDDAPLRALTVSEMNRLRESLLTALAPHFTQQGQDSVRLDHCLVLNVEMNKMTTGNHYLPETREGCDAARLNTEIKTK